MVIYGDIVFLENFIVDYFLLNVTSKILMIKAKKSRLLIASAIGALYTFTLLIPKLRIISSLPFQLLIAFIIIAISFKKRNLIIIIKGTIFFVFVSALLSGICFLFLMISNNSITNNNILSSNSIKNIILAIIVIYFFCCRLVNIVKDRAFISNFNYELNLEIDSIQYKIKGFLDTGNELREPASDLPCIIVENWILKDVNLKTRDIYYIPYKGVGIQGKLIGIKADRIMIKSENEDWKEVQALICLCKDCLSKENDFNALLSRGIV